MFLEFYRCASGAQNVLSIAKVVSENIKEVGIKATVADFDTVEFDSEDYDKVIGLLKFNHVTRDFYKSDSILVKLCFFPVSFKVVATSISGNEKFVRRILKELQKNFTVKYETNPFLSEVLVSGKIVAIDKSLKQVCKLLDSSTKIKDDRIILKNVGLAIDYYTSSFGYKIRFGIC